MKLTILLNFSFLKLLPKAKHLVEKDNERSAANYPSQIENAGLR
jgi:hypothetical protein